MQKDTNLPEIKAQTLGGMNQRVSPLNLRAGEFDQVWGMFPNQVGLLQRLPGRTLLQTLPVPAGKILKIHGTGNATNDVLVDTTRGLYVYTLDQFLNRATTPNLVYVPTVDEEAMSEALIFQIESGTGSGGTIQGYISGTDSASTADTFYGRRLTTMLTNESSTVSAFTASTGGAGAPSTAGTFTLVPGTYRIDATLLFAGNAATTPGFTAGLYNVTSAAFEVYTGGTTPIVSTSQAITVSGASAPGNFIVRIKGNFVVSSTNKTYAIYQKCSTQIGARSPSCCGNSHGMTGTNVNGAVAPSEYASIQILKTA